MLSEAEVQLVENNPELPGLRTLLDGQRVADLLGREATVPVDDIRVRPVYIRFKPTASCLTAYECRANDRVFRCYAKTNSPENETKIAKAAARPTIEGPLGPGRIIDRNNLITLSFFPNDTALRALRHYLVKYTDIRVLAYKPERRFVGLIGDKQTGGTVVKLYKPSAFEQASELAHIALGLPFMPKLVGINARRNALKLAWMPGQTLTQQLADDSQARRTAAAAGIALARLHRTKPPVELPIRTHGAERRQIHAIRRGIHALLPPLDLLAQEIADGIDTITAECTVAPGLIHGDFYANQIVDTPDGVRLLDFDELSVGIPETDLGLFIAHLEYDVLRGRLDRTQVEPIATALLAAYRGERVYDTRAVLAQAVSSMFQLAHRPFRDALEDWPTLTRDWLMRIEHWLQRPPRWLRDARSRSSPGLSAPGQEPMVAILRDAVDQTASARLIEQALQSVHPDVPQPVLDRVTVLRHKPGRRAVLEYRLIDLEKDRKLRVLGKIRAKGLDERVFAMNQALYRAVEAQGPDSPLRVPRPLAEVPALHMWLQEWVDGRSGWSALVGEDAHRSAAAVARAIHRLHRLEVPVDKHHAIADELTILMKRIERLVERLPTRRWRLENLLRDCHSLSEELANRPRCCIHRDFYPDQIIVRAEQVYLLDLDLFCMGDPAVDLGNFIAHVQEMDLRKTGDPSASAGVIETFLSTYFTLSDDPMLPRAVEIYRLLSLARLVQISAEFPDREPFTLHELEYCERQISFALGRIKQNKLH